MLSVGMCIKCKRKFWWTGERTEVPSCGGCGRRHTEVDFKYVKERGVAAEADRDRAEAERLIGLIAN